MPAQFSIDATLLSFFWFVLGGPTLIHALNTSLGAIRGLDVWTIQELAIYQRFAHFIGYNPKIVQPIQGMLCKALDPRFELDNPWVVLIRTLSITCIPQQYIVGPY